MIVVDASVLTQVLLEDADAWLVTDVGEEWYSVPHLHVETLSALRGLVLGRKVESHRAERSAAALIRTAVTMVDIPGLLPRMWELRHNLTAYDAAYVAAAEQLACPLVTADARLARAPGIRCEVRLAA